MPTSMSPFRIPLLAAGGPDRGQDLDQDLLDTLDRGRAHLQEAEDILTSMGDSEEANAHTLQGLGLLAYALLSGAMADGD